MRALGAPLGAVAVLEREPPEGETEVGRVEGVDERVYDRISIT